MKAIRPERAGMALLTVLLLVAVMAVVAVAVLDDVRFSVRRTTNAEAGAQAVRRRHQGRRGGAFASATRRRCGVGAF